jgi:hypothetical protein
MEIPFVTVTEKSISNVQQTKVMMVDLSDYEDAVHNELVCSTKLHY